MTSYDQNHFYVTMLSNASRDIYDQNTHADFTMKLTAYRPVFHLQVGSGRLRNFVYFVNRGGKPLSYSTVN